MGKIFEIVIARQITAWAEKSGVLADGKDPGQKMP
jgi:hypothetical protein